MDIVRKIPGQDRTLTTLGVVLPLGRIGSKPDPAGGSNSLRLLCWRHLAKMELSDLCGNDGGDERNWVAV